jgi:hypothetical protein
VWSSLKEYQEPVSPIVNATPMQAQHTARNAFPRVTPQGNYDHEYLCIGRPAG